jgi:acyl dehydratase
VVESNACAHDQQRVHSSKSAAKVTSSPHRALLATGVATRALRLPALGNVVPSFKQKEHLQMLNRSALAMFLAKS